MFRQHGELNGERSSRLQLDGRIDGSVESDNPCFNDGNDQRMYRHSGIYGNGISGHQCDRELTGDMQR
jgi:hypothetical protein